MSLDRIFSAMTDYAKAMGGLHNDFLGIVRRDIERFMEMTGSIHNQMQWQAWSVVGLSAVGASLAVVGSLIPKGGANPTSTALSNPRLGANDGINDAFSNTMKWLGDQLRNNDLLRSTSKSAGKFFNGVAPAANVWYQGQTTSLQAKQELMRVCFQDANQDKRGFSQEVNQVQQTALSILQAKSKGG